MALLPPDLAEEPLQAAALERGLGVYGLAPYWVSGPGPAGLVFGYGSLTPKEVVEGIELLADAIGYTPSDGMNNYPFSCNSIRPLLLLGE